MNSRSKHRDYSGREMPRGNSSKGQSRGASRGHTRDNGENSKRADRKTNFNTIQHSKGIMPIKPSAQIGNYVHIGATSATSSGLGVFKQPSAGYQ
jgi:hypothetical protein